MKMTVNAKWYAFKYVLVNILSKSLEKDKMAIKNGATITEKDYCDIVQIPCKRESWEKEAQAIADEYLTKLGYKKKVTNYIRIDINNIPEKMTEKVENAIKTMETSNDYVTTKVLEKLQLNK